MTDNIFGNWKLKYTIFHVTAEKFQKIGNHRKNTTNMVTTKSR